MKLGAVVPVFDPARWCGEAVAVKLHPRERGAPRCHRVSVWGGDDFGMEKEFSDLGEARAVFRLLTGGDRLSEGYLRKLGFRPG